MAIKPKILFLESSHPQLVLCKISAGRTDQIAAGSGQDASTKIQWAIDRTEDLALAYALTGKKRYIAPIKKIKISATFPMWCSKTLLKGYKQSYNTK